MKSKQCSNNPHFDIESGSKWGSWEKFLCAADKDLSCISDVCLLIEARRHTKWEGLKGDPACGCLK